VADRFLSRDDEKQLIVGLALARARTRIGERAIVATAERDRITVFWTRANGSWAHWTRRHEPPPEGATSPARAAALPWSSRVGLAAVRHRLFVFSKRCISAGGPTTLWVDLLEFDPAEDRFAPHDPPGPHALPLGALGFSTAGLSLWADAEGDDVLVLAQLERVRLVLPGRPPPPARPPQLVLLRGRADGEPADPGTWRATVLDEGGYDFDARREGSRLAVVHRRRPAMYAVEFFPPVGGPPFVTLPLTDRDDGPAPLLRSMAAPLALVEVDLAADTASVDDDVPFMEHPQIHRLDPVVVTGDRLRDAVLTLGPDDSGDGGGVIDARGFNGRKAIAVRETGTWRAGVIPALPSAWAASVLPRHAQDLASLQTLVGFTGPPLAGQRVGLELSTLMGLSPVALFAATALDKGIRLTFLHLRPEFAAIALTAFDVVPADEVTLTATPVGFSLPDIGHARITRPPLDGEVPPEHEQFAPFDRRGPVEHADGFALLGPERTINELGGAIVADRDMPHTFYAYVGMGDGGGRVIYEPDVGMPPADTPLDHKELEQGMVPETGETDRVWVTLETPDFLPLALPPYRVGIVDLAAPRSIASGVQPDLDDLSRVAALLSLTGNGLPGGEIQLDGDNQPTRLVLREVTAATIQDFMLTLEPSSERFTSDAGQPFEIAMVHRPGMLFAGVPVRFRALVPTPPSGTLTFNWSFSNGTTLEGQEVETSFTPPPGPTPRLPLALTVTLTVTATDGDVERVSQLVTRHTVTASAWALLWAPFDAMNFEDTDEDGVIDTPKPFQLRQLTLELSRYRLTFDATDAGLPDVMQIDYRPEHDIALAFRSAAGQGEVECRAGLSFSSNRVVVGGDLGQVVRAQAVSGRLLLSRRFTPGVLTSEIRVRRGAVELVRDSRGMLPNALACKPFREPTHEVVDAQADVVLTDRARGTTWLVSALAALGLALIVLAVLIPIVFVLMPVAAAALLIGGGLSAVVSALVAAGLAWIVTDLVAPIVLRGFAEERLRASLGSTDTGRQLAASGLLVDAGEGLAESIARRAIQQAREDGHDLDPPGDEGRDRFRPQVFETIVVTEGRARIKLHLG
jgi:hypothetical protein